MPKYERGFALGQRRSFLTALSLEEIRDPLRGEPHAVKGEILGDQSAPTGGAELNGRQFAHGRISASSRRPFS